MRQISEQIAEAATAREPLDPLASAWGRWARDLSKLADEIDGDLGVSETAGFPEVMAVISGLVVAAALVGLKLTELARLGCV